MLNRKHFTRGSACLLYISRIMENSHLVMSPSLLGQLTILRSRNSSSSLLLRKLIFGLQLVCILRTTLQTNCNPSLLFLLVEHCHENENLHGKTCGQYTLIMTDPYLPFHINMAAICHRKLTHAFTICFKFLFVNIKNLVKPKI